MGVYPVPWPGGPEDRPRSRGDSRPSLGAPEGAGARAPSKIDFYVPILHFLPPGIKPDDWTAAAGGGIIRLRDHYWSIASGPCSCKPGRKPKSCFGSAVPRSRGAGRRRKSGASKAPRTRKRARFSQVCGGAPFRFRKPHEPPRPGARRREELCSAARAPAAGRA